MTQAHQGGAPERSYVSSMFDDDSRYSGNHLAVSLESLVETWERDGSGEPVASTIASIRRSHSAFSGCIAGLSPKRPSRSMADGGPFEAPGAGIEIVGRSS